MYNQQHNRGENEIEIIQKKPGKDKKRTKTRYYKQKTKINMVHLNPNISVSTVRLSTPVNDCQTR